MSKPCIDCGCDCSATRCKPCENLHRRQPVLPRLLANIVKTDDGCWTWTKCLNGAGYGQIAVNGKAHKVHRVAYELLVGPIPPGLTLDHLCRNRACTNPAHLEPVTRGENVLRGVSPCAQHARKTHCPRGHPYAGDNLRVYRGRRYCHACNKRPRLAVSPS